MAPLLVSLLLSLVLLPFAGERDLTPKADFVLGKKLPDVTVVDEEGKRLSLSELVGGEVFLLSFVYTRCAASCPMIVEGIRKALGNTGGVKVVLVDFDERDTPADLVKFRKERDIVNPNWKVVLAKGESLKVLTRAVDFRFIYDEGTDRFVHPNVLIVVSPGMKISGYMLGVTYDADKLTALIAKARAGKVALNPIKGVFLKCFRYDPVTGTYTIDWSFVAMILGGVIPLGAMFYFIFLKDLLGGLRRTA
jgi:protein SCO1/2